MQKDELILLRPGIYDIEICVGVEEVKRVIRGMNSCGWTIAAMTQSEEVYTVLFRRPADG